MKNRFHGPLTPAALAASALALLLAVAPAAHAGEEGDDEATRHRTVIRHVHGDHGGEGGDCPTVHVGGDGESVHVFRMSSRGFLGVELTSLTPELRSHFGVPGDAGVMVGRVVEDSPAAAAGLTVGDILTRVDGEPVASAGELGRAIRGKEGGEVVTLDYWRDGKLEQATATLEAKDRCAFDVGHFMEGMDFDFNFDFEELGDLGVEVSGEAIESALEGLRNIDWEKQLEGLEDIDLERMEREMERVQRRLEELEIRIERQQERYSERVERREEREREREREDPDGI